jgi:uncharacterized protein (TIGR02271 family)
VNQPQSTASDLPFPGALSQVPGQRHENQVPTAQDAEKRPRQLPLESAGVPWERGWLIRLPVRAEHVEIDKRVVVYERVSVGRRETADLAHVSANVRREELRVDRTGNVGPTIADTETRDR